MDDSPLERLPGEIRNRIYELVLTEPDAVTISLAKQKARLVRHATDTTPLVKGLPATCKALRTESLQLYYSINRFVFRTYHFDDNRHAEAWIRCLQEWVRQVGHAQVSQIADIEIDLGTWICTAGLALPRLHVKDMHAIGKLFSPAACIEMCMDADLRCPCIDLMHISFPLGKPMCVLDQVVAKREANLRSVETKIFDSLSQMAWEEVFVLAEAVLRKMLLYMAAYSPTQV